MCPLDLKKKRSSSSWVRNGLVIRHRILPSQLDPPNPQKSGEVTTSVITAKWEVGTREKTHGQAQGEPQLKPHRFLCPCPPRTWVATVSPYSHTRPSQGALALHLSWAPWQAPRQICNSLHELVWVSPCWAPLGY